MTHEDFKVGGEHGDGVERSCRCSGPGKGGAAGGGALRKARTTSTIANKEGTAGLRLCALCAVYRF